VIIEYRVYKLNAGYIQSSIADLLVLKIRNRRYIELVLFRKTSNKKTLGQEFDPYRHIL